jgi:hypothetical protein
MSVHAMLPAVMPGGSSSMMAAVTTVMAAAVAAASFGEAGPADHYQGHHDPAQNDCNPASHDSLPHLKETLKTRAICHFLCAPPGNSSVSKGR